MIRGVSSFLWWLLRKEKTGTMKKNQEGWDRQVLDEEMKQNPELYGPGLKHDQTLMSHRRGTFGPLGNLADNGCGVLAVHNLLTMLGIPESCEVLFRRFNRSWLVSTLLGGLLGTNLLYVLFLLKKLGCRYCGFYMRLGSGKKDREASQAAQQAEERTRACGARAYLAVYGWSDGRGHVGAHFQALEDVAGESGAFAAYNTPNGVYHSFLEFQRAAGAWALIIIGYDRM